MNQIKIGKFISERRNEQGLTQKQLADQLSISDKTISKWECGKGMPEISMILPLCKALHIQVDDLLKGEKIPESEYKQILNAKDIGNVIFNKENQTFQILSGSKGIYNYSDVRKCQIVFEDAKYYGNSIPFSHQILISTLESFFITIRNIYVGLEIQLKNKEKLYVYVSNHMQRHHTDLFKEDVRIAEVLKEKFKKMIRKYSKESYEK